MQFSYDNKGGCVYVKNVCSSLLLRLFLTRLPYVNKYCEYAQIASAKLIAVVYII